MAKLIAFFGIITIGLLIVSLFFVYNITGSVIEEVEGNNMGLTFVFLFIILLFALVETIRYSFKSPKKELDIKKLIEEAKRESN